MKEMTKAVVTGGAGFIGSHISEELVKRGWRVIILDNLSTGSMENIQHLVGVRQGASCSPAISQNPTGKDYSFSCSQAEFVHGSVLDMPLLEDLFQGVEYVFHEAAIPSVPRSIDNPSASNETNINGTLNVLMAARNNRVKKVVYASSSSVYGDTPTLPKKEDMVPNPQSPYALTKLAGEYYCRIFNRIYNLPTACLRYFNVYGPRQNPDSQYAAVVPKFIKNILDGRAPTIFGDGEQSRDFTFVKDVVAANLLAAETDATGVFNIGSGKKIILNQLTRLMLEFLEKTDIKPVYLKERPGDVKHSLADITRARAFGYNPLYTIEKGLLEIITSLVGYSLPVSFIPNISTESKKTMKTLLDIKNAVVCVVGAGYVGLPLSEAFAGDLKTISYDIDEVKMKLFTQRNCNHNHSFTSDPRRIGEADFICISVPTLITRSKEPDMSCVKEAASIIGQNMKKGAIVILESSVIPGTTEEVVRPILEQESGYQYGSEFRVAYSPERINPGDTEHNIKRVTKIIAADDEDTLDLLAGLYYHVTPEIFRAKNIKTAEAAKLVENTQRDLNIALVNELSLMFEKIGLNTADVLDAAATKWNFQRFSPGLVGGYCIPVVPYFLVHKAEESGYHPQVILAGRSINDQMATHVAEMAIKSLNNAGKVIKGSRVLIMGCTYKENVEDSRETPVVDIIKELMDYGVDVWGFDPIAKDPEKAFGIKFTRNLNDSPTLDCIIVAVAHDRFREIRIEDLKKIMNSHPILIDIRGLFDTEETCKSGIVYRRL